MLLDDLCDYLVSKGVDAGEIFLNEIPAHAPSSAIGIIETAGSPPRFVHNRTSPVAEYPSFQLRTRDVEYQAARTKCQTVVNHFLKARNVTVNGVRYLGVVPVQMPFDGGRDEKGLHLVICNFDVTKEPS